MMTPLGHTFFARKEFSLFLKSFDIIQGKETYLMIMMNNSLVKGVLLSGKAFPETQKP